MGKILSISVGVHTNEETEWPAVIKSLYVHFFKSPKLPGGLMLSLHSNAVIKVYSAARKCGDYHEEAVNLALEEGHFPQGINNVLVLTALK